MLVIKTQLGGGKIKDKMKLACIDIGTNSLKLVVADVENQQITDVVYQGAAVTRIGQGVDKNRKLLPEAMDRTLNVIKTSIQEAERIGAQKITIVATSAVRDAQNRDEFAQKVTDRTGLELLVLSGDEEAKLTYTGTCSYPELRSGKIILVDVGGGSSDFVVGQNGEMEDAFSIDTGFIRLTEEFMRSDPVAPDELQSTVDHVKSMLQNRLAAISMDGRHLVGVGGTISCLANMYQAIYQRMGIRWDNIHGFVLQRKEITGMLRKLSQMKLEDRQKMPGLPPNRADVIVAGTAIFSVIMEILDAKEITVSGRGMRFGVLLSMKELV